MGGTERLFRRLETAYDRYLRESNKGKETSLPGRKILRSEPDQAVRNEVIKQLILRLSAQDGTLVKKYHTMLARIGPDALPELVRATRYRKTARDQRFDGREAAHDSRVNAALVIGEMGVWHGDMPSLGKKVIMDVVRLLAGDTSDQAMKALARIRDPLAVEAIAGLLDKKGTALKRAAVEALDHMGEAGLPHIFAALDNPDGSVRSSAAHALYIRFFCGVPTHGLWNPLSWPDIHAVSGLVACLEDDAHKVAKFSYRMLDRTLDATYEKEKIGMFMEELAEGYIRLLEKRRKTGMQEPGFLEPEFLEVASRMRSGSAAFVLISILKGGDPIYYIRTLSDKALEKAIGRADQQERKEMVNVIIVLIRSDWFMAEMRKNSPAYERAANNIADLLSKLKASEQKDIMLEPKINARSWSNGKVKLKRAAAIR
jgi:hypothetical protein